MDYNKLQLETCCFTCANNRNNLNKDYESNCKFRNKEDRIRQDDYCIDYEEVYDNE